jgi:hypothetical protein
VILLLTAAARRALALGMPYSSEALLTPAALLEGLLASTGTAAHALLIDAGLLDRVLTSLPDPASDVTRVGFSDGANRALTIAVKASTGQASVTTVHLLYGLLDPGVSTECSALAPIDLEGLRTRVLHLLESDASVIASGEAYFEMPSQHGSHHS